MNVHPIGSRTPRQIAVRLPAELVDFLDDEVAAGRASGRADLVAGLLRRERRRRAALADAAIYAGVDPADDDLAGVQTLAATTDFTDLD